MEEGNVLPHKLEHNYKNSPGENKFGETFFSVEKKSKNNFSKL